MKGVIKLKKERNCGGYPVYPNMMPMYPMYENCDLAILTNKVNNLEQRVNNLENNLNKSYQNYNNNYNTSNYQMM